MQEVTGFWLQHSAPKFPGAPGGSPLRSYSGIAPAQQLFGQHFVCLSLGADGIEAVARSLQTSFPFVYSRRMPPQLQQSLPQVNDSSQSHVPQSWCGPADIGLKSGKITWSDEDHKSRCGLRENAPELKAIICEPVSKRLYPQVRALMRGRHPLLPTSSVAHIRTRLTGEPITLVYKSRSLWVCRKLYLACLITPIHPASIYEKPEVMSADVTEVHQLGIMGH